uniref:Uncharacterized protein n=1 Tax=Oryza nivara TaxID=4536 RepID=A0A0E0HG97_ORYNI
MPGRSCGSSCTQRSPTWMHRRSSCGRRPAAGQPSSSSPAPPRLQCLQTCTPASRISVAAAGDDLEEEHAVAEDVGFGREDAVQRVLRRHVSAEQECTLNSTASESVSSSNVDHIACITASLNL